MRRDSDAEYSTVPAADFVAAVLPSLARRPLQCTQRGGDVVYVPSGWGHAVLNVRTSIGFAVEFDSPLHSRY